MQTSSFLSINWTPLTKRYNELSILLLILLNKNIGSSPNNIGSSPNNIGSSPNNIGSSPNNIIDHSSGL